jgi:histidyl-tRNA synthetase
VARRKSFATAERLRERIAGLCVSIGQPSSGFKAQMRRADKSGARFAVIIGEDELASDKVSIKALRRDSAQRLLTVDEVVEYLRNEPAATC